MVITSSLDDKGLYAVISIFVCGKSYISEHAIAVQTDENMMWLRYKLENWNLNRFSESSAQPGLSVEKLVRYKLTVPTLNEQIGIATILQLWDTAIEKQSELVEKHQIAQTSIDAATPYWQKTPARF
jgi:Type I restriction modification DNA specificity domain.